MIILKKAGFEHKFIIWNILQEGIKKRKKEGSTQWQNGYPNLKTIEEDIKKDRCFIALKNNAIIATVVIDLKGEKVYEQLNNWQYNGQYATIHRFAITNKHKGKGWAKIIITSIENYVKSYDIKSIRIDTAEDNNSMLNILNSLKYVKKGIVYYDLDKRIAFEKLLD